MIDVKPKSGVGQLLLRQDTSVTCPKCATEFSLDQGFAKKALEQLSEVSAAAIAAMRDAERAEVEKRAQQLAGERARAAQTDAEALKKLLKEQGDSHAIELAEVRSIAEKNVAPRIVELQKALAEQTGQVQALRAREDSVAARERELESRVDTAAQAKAAGIVAAERAAFGQQLADRDNQVATLRAEQLQLRKEREQLKDEQAALTLEVQRQVDAHMQHREAMIRAQEQGRANLEKAELQKKLDDAGEQLAAAQRKMEQGSQQLQGEVLELAIEDGLRRAFPLDTIEEVKKGQRGGDVLQHVTTRTGQAAGTILWETKRAKDWSSQWIPKLKEDMRACGAAVGILVTMPGALPKEWPGSAYFALHEDVWVTQASCAVGIAELLRVGLIDLHRQRAVSAGKGEKMEALYDYLTSPQFAQKLKAVYETFTKMREELESEKNVTMQRWARRDKQLQGGMTQLLSIGGEIQGLAHEELPMLEMEPQRDMPI
ncbi:MAG: DUF2130 domain-containing protein [Steroidobacteraceae bacterium]